MRIDSSGRLLVGTTTASGSQMDIVDATGYNNRALTISRSATNAASKSSAISIRHWLNAEEPVMLIGAGIDGNTSNSVRIGGGFSNLNAATTVAFYTAANNATLSGTERMRIDSSGNIGIGTSSPSVKLHTVSASEEVARFERNSGSGYTRVDIKANVVGDTGNSAISFSDTSGTPGRIDYEHADNSLSFSTNTAERMRIDSSGNLLVGATSGNGRLTVRGAGTTGSTYSFEAATSGGNTRFIIADNGQADFYNSSNALSMRITSSGNLLAGTSSTFDNVSFLIAQFLGGVSTKIAGTGATSQMSFFNDNGRVGYIGTSGTTTTYYTSSDARLKHDITDAPEASDLIDAIKVRSFKWNVDDSEQRYGFVAQELFEVAPEAVGGSPDSDEMMAVDYSKLVPMLVKEIQSMRLRLAQLEG
jgi:hypothetical protein